MTPSHTSSFHGSIRVLPGSVWEGPMGNAYVGVVAERAVLAVLIGRVDEPAGDILYNAIRGALTPGVSGLFYDVWSMVGYHSHVRVRCTAVALEHVDRVEVHTLASSKLVRMGVAVANLALGGRVNMHDTAETFAKDFQRVSSGQGARTKAAG